MVWVSNRTGCYFFIIIIRLIFDIFFEFYKDDEKEDGNSTPYSSTYSVSAHNENIKRASNYNDIGIFNNDEDYPENDSFYMDNLQKKIHK